MEDEDNEVIESLKALNDTIADYTPTGRFDEELFGQIRKRYGNQWKRPALLSGRRACAHGKNMRKGEAIP